MKQLSLIALSLVTTLLIVQPAKAQTDNVPTNDDYSGGNLLNVTGSFNTALGKFALMADWERGHMSGSYNTGIGHHTLWINVKGSSNTAIGALALSSNSSGSSNTAVGASALNSNTSGNWNVAVGYQALMSNQIGYFNMASGYQALTTNTTGVLNTASGTAALAYTTTGSYNTAAGGYALYKNTTASNNTASGYYALYNTTTGFNNTAIGNYALRNTTTGSRNTAVGDSAGARYSYNYSTFLGYKTTTSVSGLTNVTVIGNQASATASNQVRIGNSSVTSIGGKVGWTTLSDGRYKKNIQADVPGLEFITKLKPVTYTLDIAAIDKASGLSEEPAAEQGIAKTAAAKEKHTGFVAQEVEKAAQDIKYEFGGVDKPKNSKDLYGLRYAEFVVPLVKAVQELHEKDKEIDELKARIERLEKLVSGANNTLSSTSGSLEQNTPNPANGTTTIRYQVAQTSNTARLSITDAKGQLVQTISLSNKGVSQVNVSTSMLAAGTYNYTLYVDGKQADSKRLIIAR